MEKLDKKVVEDRIRAHESWLDKSDDESLDIEEIVDKSIDDNLGRADFGSCNLEGFDFSDANLERANFTNAQLKYANFSGANLSLTSLIRADFSFADLTNTMLFGANIREAIFFKAVLDRATLNDASLARADLRKASLVGASLGYADLFAANLQSADLSDADLEGADLREADLRNCNLEGANLAKTLRENTLISSRDELAIAKIESYDGFVFSEEDEEKTKQESEARDRKAEETLNVEEKGFLLFSLPDTYGPAQVGRVLFLLSLWYEGVRIALLSPQDEKDLLFNKAMMPELYGAHNDKYSLKLVSIENGSVKGVLEAIKGILETILLIKNEWQSGELHKEKLNKEKIENAEAAARFTENRENALIRQAEKLSDLACKRDLPEDITDKLHDLVRSKIGKIENHHENLVIAVQVQEYASVNLLAMQEKLGGEFKALDQDLLPESIPGRNERE